MGVVPMVDTSVEVVKRSELIVAQLERVCMVGASWGVACELCALLCRPESRCTASCARYSALPTGGLKARLPQVGVGRWGKGIFRIDPADYPFFSLHGLFVHSSRREVILQYPCDAFVAC